MCRQSSAGTLTYSIFLSYSSFSFQTNNQYRILMSKRKQARSARRANLNIAHCNKFVSFIFTLCARVHAKRLRIRMFRTQRTSKRYVYVYSANTSNQFARFIIKCVRIVCGFLFFFRCQSHRCVFAGTKLSATKQSREEKKQQQYAL